MPTLSTTVAAGLLAGVTVTASVVTLEQDLGQLPPTHDVVEAKLRAGTLSLSDAIATAQQQVGGIARSAQLDIVDDALVANVLVYNQGAAQRITLDASGAVTGTEPVSFLPGAYAPAALQATDSGLQYAEITEGTGAMPTAGATVEFHFTAWLTDGQKIASSRDAPTPVNAPMGQLIPGWKEGLATMKEGGRRKLVVPSELGFPPGQGVPTGAMLIFDMELLRVIDYSAVPAAADLPGWAVAGDPVSTDSGLMYFEVEPGSGAMPAGPTTNVRVHYTGYLNDGTKFDSSVDRGTPADFPLNRVIAGWTEGVGSMKVGGKRKLIIPYQLGYGEQGNQRIPGGATLVFDVELIEILP